MNLTKLLLVILFCSLLNYGQVNEPKQITEFEFEDDFNAYIAGGQLACQNPIDWTTWSNFPCDPVEDPFINNNFSYSWPNSVSITLYNDLIKPLGNFSTGRNHTTFYVYVPNGKTGYFSLLSKFNPDSNEVAFECYFDVGGTGRLMMIPGEPVLFNYTNNEWHLAWIVVDFYIDEAEFWFDYNLIHTWEWTQNGTLTNQLAAHNFSGLTPNDEIYIDDYYLFENNCLFCYPPDAPSNLVAEVRFNPDTLVELNWQINFGVGMPYGCKILRINGLPNNFIPYEIIGTTSGFDSTYTDSNVLMDSSYTYAVIAFNVFGTSDTSNTATITIDPTTNVNHIEEPLTYSLEQNYPNPFNPTTTIAFTISDPPAGRQGVRFTILKVYDVLGNEIATLVNEEKPAGSYEVEFFADGLPSGIYFYQLQAGNYIETKKMILMK